MKNIFLIIAILCLSIGAVQAQTGITSDRVIVKTIDTMLVSSESVNIDYYVKDFLVANRILVTADTALGTGTGDVVMTVITKGSLNNVDWTNIDTVSISDSDDNVAGSPLLTPYYDYVRYTVAVAGTGDSVDVTLNILFDVND